MAKEILKSGWRKMKKNKNILSRDAFDKILRKGNTISTQSNLDVFEREAIEGWKSSSYTFDDLKKLDKKFSRNIISTSKWLYYSLSIMMIIVLVITLIPKEKIAKKSILLKIEKTELVIPERIDTMTELPLEKQIEYVEVLKSQHYKSPSPQNTEKSKIQMPDFALRPLPVNIPQKPIPLIKQQKAKEIILNDLKAIDYTQYRKEQEILVEQVVLTGLPANYENESAIISDKTVVIPHQIQYTEYLEKSLFYIQQKKWKNALVRFQEILRSFPNDVNAHFYAGWCSYNLSQFDAASIHFSACLQLEYSNFNEESTWYLALSLKAIGKKEIARELFEEIKQQKGYYSNLAEKELTK